MRHYTSAIQVEVSLCLTNYQPNSRSNAVVRFHTWDARCFIGDEMWVIEDQFVPNSVYSYFLTKSNVFVISRVITQPKVSENGLRGLPPNLVNALTRAPSESDWQFLTILPGDLPLENIGCQLPWLALCSGDYLRGPDRRIPLPGIRTRFSPEAFAFSDTTRTFPDPLGLPERVEFFASQKLYTKSVRRESLVRMSRTQADIRNVLHPRLGVPEGFLTGRYDVLTQTNWNGYRFPTLFTYEEYRPNPNGGERSRVRVCYGRVTSICMRTMPAFELSDTARYSVSDYRFRDPRKVVDMISYAITNGRVPPVSDAALQALFAKHVQAAAYDPAVEAHMAMYFGFVVLVAGPIIAAGCVWLLRKWKQKAQINNF